MSERIATVHRLPERPKPAQTMGRVPVWLRLRDRLADALGRALARLSIPGAVQPTVVEDELTGQRLEISVSARFTRISVDGRDYYFRRLSGRWDGSGTSQPTR